MTFRRTRKRPTVLVLAGVNGAGKSSVLGTAIRAEGLDWYNPDHFSRERMARAGVSKDIADAEAWAYGKTRLEAAIAGRTTFAFETTLGGTTISRLLAEAAKTHDMQIIYCGLASVELHIERVKMRVRQGGHDIPEDRIRRRWDSSRRNLIELMPRLARLHVFDNSEQVASGADVPLPRLVLHMENGRIVFPDRMDVEALRATPDWAKAIMEAALQLHDASAAEPAARRARRKKLRQPRRRP